LNCRNPFYLKRGNGKIEYKRIKSLSPELRLQFTPFPCGKCIECRITKAKHWATRILLESTQYKDNTFTTLTYSDDEIPKGGNLDKTEPQKWLKRLRKVLDHPIRYFIVGEYGEETYRPHYHAILFNYPFYDEATIEATWQKGHISNGEVTPQSARYVTEYCVKKWTSNSYDRPDHLDAEFMLSSRGKSINDSKVSGGVGISAIRELAQNLRCSYQVEDGKPYEGPPIHHVQYQNKWYPLDKYMRLKLNTELFQSEERAQQQLYQYQELLFEAHLTEDNIFAKNEIARQNRQKSDKRQRKERKLKPARTGI